MLTMHELQPMLDQIGRRLEALERQIALLSEKAGVPYALSVSATVPADVLELARAGQTLDAVRRYRELTGASGDEARAFVSTL
jgi:hypothetical protein